MFGPDGPRFRELFWQAMASTQGGYDLLAPKFDTTPFRTPDPILERVVQHLEAGPPVRAALDVCCGTGAALGHLRPLCEVVVGIDFSPGMLAEARRRLQGVGGGRLELVRGDVRAMPFRSGFDLATCFGAFGHITRPEQPAFLRGIRRALRPGGRFVFVAAEPPSPMRRSFWLAHGFNAAMRVRNRLFDPPFVMYYLNFTLAEALGRLVEAGFEPSVAPLRWPVRPELMLVTGHVPERAG